MEHKHSVQIKWTRKNQTCRTAQMQVNKQVQVNHITYNITRECQTQVCVSTHELFEPLCNERMRYFIGFCIWLSDDTRSLPALTPNFWSQLWVWLFSFGMIGSDIITSGVNQKWYLQDNSALGKQLAISQGIYGTNWMLTGILDRPEQKT